MDARLTQRERQVAELIAWGAAQKEVPDLLVEKYGGEPISVNTVQNILAAIYQKTGTNKANELAAWWFVHEIGVTIETAPAPSIKQRLLSLALLVLLAPQLLSADYQAVRTGRTGRTTRTVRVERGRRREDKQLEPIII